MPMIGHEAIREQPHRRAFLSVVQDAHEGFVVALVIEDRSAIIASIEDVKNHATRATRAALGIAPA